MWVLGIPAVGTACFLVGGGWRWRITPKIVMPFGLFNETARAEIIWMVATASTALALFVVGAGLFARKRIPFVVAHLAVSTWVAGILISITTVVGWPLWWTIAHLAVSTVFAISWNYYRGDALRGDPREKDAGDDTFGKLIGLPRAVVGQPTIDAHHVVAEIDPGLGKTMADVANRMDAIEDQVKPALTGRSRLDRDPVTKKIRMVFTHRDPLDPWPLWSGPSNPGGSFAEGGVCGQYADALPERINFAAYTDERGNLVPAGHLGTVGTTRAGKSGCGCVLWTDIAFTRRDVLVVYIDCAKPGQSLAAQVMGDIVLYADGYPKAKRLLEALGKLAFARAARMGAAGHRDWTARTFEELGLPALLVVIDEADLVCGTPQFRDLVTKCLSAGIYVHALMPRADGDSMDTTARTAMNQWQVFGTGDDYSHTFAMTKRTVLAGGDKVCDWRNTKPGYHFLDAAPGVEERRYAMEIRSLRAEFNQMVPHIVAGRRYRARMHPDDVADLGRAWDMFQPPRQGMVPPPRAATPRTVRREPTGKEKIDMHSDPDQNPYDIKDWAAADLDEVPPVPAMDDPEPDDVERYANADPDELRVPDEVDDEHDLTWDTGDDRPEAPTRQAAYEAFDLVLREMADADIETFTNKDVIARFPYKRSVGWMSERMDRVCRGDVVSPPGATIERLDRGEFLIVREPTTIEGTFVASNPP